MVANISTITFSGVDQLIKSIELQEQKVKRTIAGQFLYAQGEAVMLAKKNAPWTDRTTNARNGLHAKVNVLNDATVFELVLAHSVFYGIFLETRFSGKYAVIMPTMNHVGRLIISRIQDSLDQMGAVV